MKRIILTILLLTGIIVSGISQEKLSKKEAKKQKDLAEWHEVKKLIDTKTYVFTGSLVDGTTIDPKINFIKVDGDKGVIQFSNGFGGGANGIGGITGEGVIEKYSVSAKKEGKAIRIRFRLIPGLGQGFRGPIDVSLTVFSFDSAQLGLGGYTGIMQGEIRSIKDSKIFKGNTLN